MRQARSRACAWLLFLFVLGAAIGVLLRGQIPALQQRLGVSNPLCLAALLGLDACMAGSLLARPVLSPATLVFGALAAQEVFQILHGAAQGERLALLALVTPLHFAAACRGLMTAGRLRSALRARDDYGRLLLFSAPLMLLAVIGCILTLMMARGASL